MISRFLIALTGADPVLLAQVREVRKYERMGGAVLTTGVLASVSATFALKTAVDAPLWLALGLGLVWGLAILNLDSWIVSSTKRLASASKNLLAALPRLVLAVVLGFVISEPLVLQVFSSEINAELAVMRAEQEGEFDDALTNDPRYQRTAREKEEVRRIEDELATGVPADAVVENPDVQQAQAAYDRVDGQLQQAQARTSCEGQGTCGTGAAGAGRVFQTNLETQQRLQRQAEQALAALTEARAVARAEAEAEAEARARAAHSRLDELTTSIANAEQQRSEEIREHRAELEASDGLLARMEALGRVSEDKPDLAIARWFLFLFLLVIECTPVLIKLITNLGPPSDYEKLLEMEQKRVLDQRELESQASLDVAALQLWGQRRESQAELERADMERTAPLRAEKQADEATLQEQAVLHQATVDAARLRAEVELETARVQAEVAAQQVREPDLHRSLALWARHEQARQEALAVADAAAADADIARAQREVEAQATRDMAAVAAQARLAVHERKMQQWRDAQEPFTAQEVEDLLEAGRQEARARAAELALRQARVDEEAARIVRDAARERAELAVRTSELAAQAAEAQQREDEAARSAAEAAREAAVHAVARAEADARRATVEAGLAAAARSTAEDAAGRAAAEQATQEAELAVAEAARNAAQTCAAAADAERVRLEAAHAAAVLAKEVAELAADAARADLAAAEAADAAARAGRAAAEQATAAARAEEVEAAARQAAYEARLGEERAAREHHEAAAAAARAEHDRRMAEDVLADLLQRTP